MKASGQRNSMGKDLAVGREEVDGVEHHVLEELTKDQRWGTLETGREGVGGEKDR